MTVPDSYPVAIYVFWGVREDWGIRLRRAGPLSQYAMTAVVVVSDLNSQRDHKTAVLLGATHMIYIAKA